MIPSILIGIAVAAAVFFAARSVLKNRHSCDGDCAACGSDCCHVSDLDTVKEELVNKIKAADREK